MHHSLHFFAKTARFLYLCQLVWSISPATVIWPSPNFVHCSAHHWYISVQNISLVCGEMSTQLLVLQPSKSSALGKSIKQPKQNPEVLTLLPESWRKGMGSQHSKTESCLDWWCYWHGWHRSQGGVLLVLNL